MFSVLGGASQLLMIEVGNDVFVLCLGGVVFVFVLVCSAKLTACRSSYIINIVFSQFQSVLLEVSKQLISNGINCDRGWNNCLMICTENSQLQLHA